MNVCYVFDRFCREVSSPVMQLSGIEPLKQDEKPALLESTTDSKESEDAADKNNSHSVAAAPQPSNKEEAENLPSVPAVPANEVNGETNDVEAVEQEQSQIPKPPSDDVELSSSDAVQKLELRPPGEELLPSSQTAEHDFEASEVSTSDVESVTPVAVTAQPRDTNAVLPQPLQNVPLSIVNTVNPANVAIPPVGVVPVHQPPTSIPRPLPPHLIPGLIPGIPPPVRRSAFYCFFNFNNTAFNSLLQVSATANVNIFQHPPPPFPIFPSLTLPPGQFSQPPPTFPPHPNVLQPPPSAMSIPSLAKTSSSGKLYCGVILLYFSIRLLF